MDSFYFEEKIQEYKKSIGLYNYNVTSFQLLISFYQELFSTNNKLLIEIYLTETISYLILHLKIYSCFGRSPAFSDSIISLAEGIVKKLKGSDDSKLVKNHLTRIIEERKRLQIILDGQSIQYTDEFSISFLVTEKTRDSKKSIGIVESLSISINKNKKTDGNEFNIVPSLPKIEEKLQRQISDSWTYATNYLKSRYHKNIPILEITIKFVNKLGFYEGDSLGIALTIGFIEELFAFFDLRESLIFSNNIITTGSIDANGIVNEVSKSIIEIKTLAAFYSSANIFLLPIADYPYALKIIETELKKYPNRNLELIPIKNIKDAINRRDLLVVKKQNLLKWGSKKLIKNKISLSLIIILFSLIFSFFYLYEDTNPHHIEYSKNSYLVLNKYGKILWEKKTDINFSDFPIRRNNAGHRIIDYDEDGINEILFSDDIDHSIKLYSSKGDIIWTRKFSYKNLKTATETFTDTFGNIRIIGINESNYQKTIIATISHSPYFPTAIAKFNLKNGKQLGELFWHTGGITDGELFDIDNDGKSEILCTGINNGLRRGVFFILDYDSLKGQSPRVENYSFLGIEDAKFDHYVLLPKPDYFRYTFSKYDKPFGFSVDSNRNLIQIGMVAHTKQKNDGISVSVRFDLNINLKEIIVTDQYIFERNKLVTNGKLDYPLTDTDEYRKRLENHIEYWDGEKFIKFGTNK